jgi:multidrug efflux pump subunit AcrA (membrane-fusion protein)
VAGAIARQAANATSTANSIAKARLAREKAVLEEDQRRFESDLIRHQADLDGRQAEIDLAQALRDSVGQARVDSLEVAQVRLRKIKQEARVRRYRTYVEDMAARAPAAGMVVYHRSYTDEGIQVYRAGDEVHRASTVLEITDTSVMKVQFSVHEQDRWRISEGLPVTVVLDAFTGTRFTGTIEKVSSLPLERPEGRIAQRFEVVAVIDDRDERLKPGMSARVTIELGGLP